MNMTEALAALTRGGFTPPPDSHDESPSDGAPLPRYQPSRDPAGAEELGRALARALRDAAADPDAAADTVLVWDDSDDLVLAHVVARELGATVMRALEIEGLVLPLGEHGPPGAVVLLADAFRTRAALRALHALAAREGGRVTAIAALIATPQLDAAAGLPVHTLLPERRPGAPR
ncbi:hypothetical protein ACIP5Y_11600 [Nocardia sp. NPDC088792]|uniref:hypothetical protein n=1 Tax=Nocardia sp. NPDC088792 TaxID=3364332 RepID=UPI0038035086